MLITSNEYLQAVQEINDYVNQAKYRASVSVNSEVLKTNLFIGSVIIRNSQWGNKFVDNLSKDMRMKYPGAKGYSVRNLKYMKKFAQIFAEDDLTSQVKSQLYERQVVANKISILKTDCLLNKRILL